MKSVKIITFLVSLAVAVLAFAAVEPAKQDASNSYILCRNQKTVRTIRVDNTEDNKCVALYTKSGVDREVGRAQNVSTCMKVVENIKGNLEAAKWKCREISDVRITSSENE